MTDKEPSWAQTFAEFIEASPTSYHTAMNAGELLTARGFTGLDERVGWEDVSGKHFAIRDGAIIAWLAPEKVTENTGLKIVGTHTDSPALKLKPTISYQSGAYQMADVEVYGGPLLTTWPDRELCIAGRIVDRELNTYLVKTPAALRISSLAPHLDRKAATNLTLDRQTDIMPIFFGDDLAKFIWETAEIDPDEVAGFDLFVIPSQNPELMGDNLASYRLDNLASSYPALYAILGAEPGEDVIIWAGFDHEEIGSESPSGASGPFLGDVLTRIATGLGYDTDQRLAWIRRGSCISADVTHALNPNKAQNYDPHTQAIMGRGPALKVSANMRYASDAGSVAIWRKACRAAGVPFQTFVNHNEIPGGTTIGPLVATRFGMSTVDVGAPIQSMHSAREICNYNDLIALSEVFTSYWLGD